MIPYGMYVLTSKSQDGQDVSAATVNWLTQTSFAPPLVAVGVKGDSGAHAHITETGVFAVNVIGKDQIDLAFTCFKSLEREGDSIGGQAFVPGPHYPRLVFPGRLGDNEGRLRLSDTSDR